MREHFAGYYQPSAAELSDLWTKGIVAIDANALLNLYRYTKATRIEFLKVLGGLAPRVWLPYQAGLEFHRRRLDVIEDQAGAYDALLVGFRNAHSAVSEPVNRYRRHPRLSAAILEEYGEAVRGIISRIESAREEYRAGMPESPHDDPTLSEITELFAGRVGDRFSEDSLRAIYEEGKSRYSQQIPPGFRDAKKGEPDCYGDLVIWKELLRKGGDESAPLVFVTDDRKDDWWWEHRGRTVGPRVELIEEYHKASGCRVHFYAPESFLRIARERNPSAVSESAIGEVEAVSRQETYNRARVIVGQRHGDLLRRRHILKTQIERLESRSSQPARDAEIMAQVYELDERLMKAKARVEDLTARARKAESEDDQFELERMIGEAIAEIDQLRNFRNHVLHGIEFDGESRRRRSLERLASQLRDIDDSIVDAERVLLELEEGDESRLDLK